MMMTRGADSVSRSVKTRPATSFAPIASKYPGDTADALGAMSDSPFCGVYPSARMAFALAFGVWLWLGFPTWRGLQHVWLDVKLLLVVAAVGYHHGCGALLKRFEQMRNQRSERWYRVFNEAAIVIFAAIVVLVVVKPL